MFFSAFELQVWGEKGFPALRNVSEIKQTNKNMVNQIMKIKPPAVKNMQINSVFGHRAITQMYHHVTDGQRGTDELTPVQKQEKRRFHRSHHGPHLPPWCPDGLRRVRIPSPCSSARLTPIIIHHRRRDQLWSQYLREEGKTNGNA